MVKCKGNGFFAPMRVLIRKMDAAGIPRDAAKRFLKREIEEWNIDTIKGTREWGEEDYCEEGEEFLN
jgi:hypothetical protein